MGLGYDGKLYILAFDHRGSFQKKWFGIQGDPSPEETERIADGKHLIFEGLARALDKGAEPHVTGGLVDEQFGGDIPRQARERGIRLAMPVEKSGQEEFDFEYGDRFGEKIEQFDPTFSKVLVRYNPEGDAAMNERQVARLRQLSEWLHERRRKFLFELLVPAQPAELLPGLGRVSARRGRHLEHRLHQLGLDVALQPVALGRLEHDLDRVGQLEGVGVEDHQLLLDADGERRPREPVVHAPQRIQQVRRL